MKKKLIGLFFVLGSFAASAQFQGTFVWGIKMEITDPKLKAQMEQANKQMNDPANQAKMKELEEKMNDPQFKAMMDQNPEMKAMLEAQIAAMKSGNGGSMLDNMMPKSIETHLKEGNSLSKIIGGAFEGESLYLKAKDETYHIDRKNKTYTLEKKTEATQTPEYKVTKTEEFTTILKYKCRKYLVEQVDQKQKVTYTLWATNDIKNLDSKQFSKMKMGNNQASFIEKVDEVPLKIQGQMPQGTMIMEVTSLKEENLPTSMFEIPEGFTKK